MIIDGREILAFINTVPFHFDKRLNELPDEGVDWGVKKSLSDYESELKPDVLIDRTSRCQQEASRQRAEFSISRGDVQFG